MEKIGKINVSMTGGSGLSLTKYRTCAMKMKWFLDGWRMKFKPYPLAFGSLVHDGNFNKLEKPDAEKPSKFFRRQMESGILEDDHGEKTPINMSKISNDKKDDEFDNGERVCDKVEENLAGEAVKEVETRFEIDLIDPANNVADSELEQFNFCGKTDALQDDAIVDLKTSKSQLTENHLNYGDYYLQTEGYRYNQAVKGNVVHKAKIWNVTKHKWNKKKPLESGPRWKVIQVERTDEDFYTLFQFVKDTCLEILESIKTGIWKRNITQCKTVFGICPYYALCHQQRFSNPKAEREKTLFKKPNSYNQKG